MIQELIQLVKTPLLALDWLEVFGGLSIPMTKPMENTSVTYPIAPNSNADCWINGRYMDLVPDSNKKSILYFEQSTPIKFRNITTVEQGIEVYLKGYLWANKIKLGDDISSEAAKSLLKTLGAYGSEVKHTNSSDFHDIRTVIQSIDPLQDSLRHFSAYDYKGVEYLGLYPNSIMTFDLIITCKINRECLSFTPGTPITCIDLS